MPTKTYVTHLQPGRSHASSLWRAALVAILAGCNGSSETGKVASSVSKLSDSLPSGTYGITSGAQSLDGGFGYWGGEPWVQLYENNYATNPGQQWAWDGSRFSNLQIAAGGAATPGIGPYLADNGDGTATENSTGDTWTLTASGSGYFVQDDQTGNYLTDNSGTLAMSPDATEFAMNSVGPASSTTACQVTVPSCPNYPDVSGTFDDDYDNSASDQARCMQRAADYYNWCGASSAVTASYIVDGVPVQSTTYPSDAGQSEFDDTDSSIIYSSPNSAVGSGWNFTSGDSEDYQSTEHYNNYCVNPPEAVPIQGPMAVVNFSGTEITLLGKAGPDFGIGAYAIDGSPITTVDAFSPSPIHQYSLANVTGLSPGSHVLSYQVTCNRSQDSSDFYQAIDGYLTDGTNLPISSASIGGYDQVIYDGEWASGPNSTNLSGGHAYSHTAGSTVSWTFTGSLIEVFGRPDSGDGLFKVIIDEQEFATVDGHYTQLDDDALTGYMMYATKLNYGSHAITLYNTGTSDSLNETEKSGVGNYLQFDEFVAFP